MTDNITRLKEALEAYERWMAAGCPIDGGQYDIYPDSFYEAATRPAAIRELLDALDKANAARRQAQEECVTLKERLASEHVKLHQQLAKAEKDARRWRHMRSAGVFLDGHDFISYGDTADHRVDAAIASQEGGRDA